MGEGEGQESKRKVKMYKVNEPMSRLCLLVAALLLRARVARSGMTAAISEYRQQPSGGRGHWPSRSQCLQSFPALPGSHTLSRLLADRRWPASVRPSPLPS